MKTRNISIYVAILMVLGGLCAYLFKVLPTDLGVVAGGVGVILIGVAGVLQREEAAGQPVDPEAIAAAVVAGIGALPVVTVPATPSGALRASALPYDTGQQNTTASTSNGPLSMRANLSPASDAPDVGG